MTCLNCLDNYVINYPSLITSANQMTDTCLLNSCPNGFYSDSLQCQQCQFGCTVCLLDGSCYICDSGFMLDPNTKRCYKNGCALGQYYGATNNSCLNCDASCLTCYSSATNCTSCSFTASSANNSQLYLSASSCVAVCPVGTFAHTESQTCRKCDPRCTTCSSFRNCTTCQANFYLLAFYDSLHTPCVAECPQGFYVGDNNTCNLCFQDCKSCYGPS
jgi:proprotein convertase subtilisin/kexin type 5